MSHHPVKRLRAPDGTRADIDVLLAPLIKALWAAGYETIGSCQDLGESVSEIDERRGSYWKGYALVELPIRDAQRLARFLGGTPQFQRKMHWAAPGAWDISVPIILLSGEILDLAQVRFPNDQLDDLVKVLTEA